MTYDELVSLNKEIVTRINMLVELKIENEMIRFKFGDYVTFRSEEGNIIKGHVKQINRKTVTIISEDRIKWRVSPNFLSKVPTGVLAKPNNPLN